MFADGLVAVVISCAACFGGIDDACIFAVEMEIAGTGNGLAFSVYTLSGVDAFDVVAVGEAVAANGVGIRFTYCGGYGLVGYGIDIGGRFSVETVCTCSCDADAGIAGDIALKDAILA